MVDPACAPPIQSGPIAALPRGAGDYSQMLHARALAGRPRGRRRRAIEMCVITSEGGVDMARQIVDNRKHARVALAVIGAGLVWVALLAAALPSLPARALASNSSPSVTPQTAFLYRFDPNTFSFFTRTLPLGSVPIDVAVTGTSPVHVWVTLFGSDKIGRLVFTSTAQTSWTEYAVTSTANSQPFQLALRGNEVWFTEQNANRVGRLNALTGQIDEFFGNGLSSDSGLAGIDIAPDGSIWLAGQKSNRLIRLVVTDTNDFAFQQYTLGSTTGPYAVAIE